MMSTFEPLSVRWSEEGVMKARDSLMRYAIFHAVGGLALR